MDNIYLPWGVYVVAVGAQMLYWSSMAPMAMTQKRVGMEGGLAGDWIWIVVLSALATLCWPVAFLTAPDYYDDPSIFSSILMTLGAWALGWLVSRAVKGMLGAAMAGTTDIQAGKMLQQIANCVTVAAIGLAVAAYASVYLLD